MTPDGATGSPSALASELARELGRFLVQRGWLTPEDLELAQDHRAHLGGSLGTCLLEAGLITEDRLTDALSQVLGVPAAFARDLEDVPRTAWGLLREKVAARYRAIPFRIVGGELWVAMEEVENLAARDEIAAVTGRRLRPHAALEARIAEALGTYYGLECPARFTELLQNLDQRPNLWGVPGGAAAARDEEEDEEDEEDEASVETQAFSPPRPRSIPLSEEEKMLLRQASQGPAGVVEDRRRFTAEPPPPAAETSDLTPEAAWVDLEVRLRQAGSLEEIGERVLAVMAQDFRHCLLVKVQGEKVSGWMGRGPGITPDRIERFSASLNQPSVFLNLHRGVGFHLGPLAEMSVHGKLADIWGGSLPAHAVVMPVRVRERLVAFLYGDRSRPEPMAVDLGEMRRLAAACASAFELFLMRKKQGKA